jgi:hypothetical protein
MELILAPSWILTTDHAASSDGQPVLVHRGTGEAYAPWDALQPYPSWEWSTAAVAVARLAKQTQLDAAGAALVARFVGSPAPAAE